MSDEPISLEEARNRRLPVQRHYLVPEEDDATSWVKLLYDPQGKLVPAVGVDFGCDGALPLRITKAQALTLATNLKLAAEELP